VVRAEIQVGVESALCDGDLVGTATGARPRVGRVAGPHLPLCGGPIGDHPACHRDFQSQHEVAALQMALKRGRDDALSNG
jgi:hypothetical protein